MELSEMQLDFILQKYYQDHPEEGKFTRNGEEDMPESFIKVAWDKVLSGSNSNWLAEIKSLGEKAGNIQRAKTPPIGKLVRPQDVTKLPAAEV